MRALLLVSAVLGCAVAQRTPPVTGLHKLVEAEDVAAIREAVLGGANIDSTETGMGGQTPLMFGCLRGKPAAVAALLELGADTSIGEKDGYTCPHGAAFQGRPDVMKVLIEHGIDVRDTHRDGFEPLHRAAWGATSRHARTIEVLVESGVPVTAPAGNGQTVMDMASGVVKDTVRRLAELREGGQPEL